MVPELIWVLNYTVTMTLSPGYLFLVHFCNLQAWISRVTGEKEGESLEYAVWLSLKGFSAMDVDQKITDGLNDLLLRFLESQNVITWKNVA